MDNLPTVSIVIVNLNGRHHLRECFDSIAKLRYPKEKIEVILVDNGSTDGSAEFVAQKYGWVKLIRNTRNEGFAKPSNDGAHAAAGEYVAFLNNDMRVQRDWLIELIRSLKANNAQCAGSVILNWDGTRLDFAGGGMSFMGYGYQDDYERPMKEMEAKLIKDKPLLFACGGAMIVDRRIFFEAGGFDEDYFAYYEDADLGWRLRVMGYNIVLSVKSRVFHKHNSTSRTVPPERIRLLYERNKLYTIYKNYGQELFCRAFIAALLLDMQDAFLRSGIDGANYDIGNPAEFDPSLSKLPHDAAVKLTALHEFAANISKMEEKRRFIQSRRRVDDAQLMQLFEKPFIVFPTDTPEFLNTEYDLIKIFGLDKAFGRQVKKKILIIPPDVSTADALDPYMAMARAMTADEQTEVTVALCGGEGTHEPGIAYLEYSRQDASPLIQAAKETNVAVIFGGIFTALPELKTILANKYTVVDLRIDDLADYKPETGDFFICNDDLQKERVSAMLAALGRVKAARAGGLYAVAIPLQSAETADYQAVAGFCESPYHLKQACRHEDEAEQAVPAVSDSGGSLRERLSRLEQNQRTIERLLRENAQAARDLGSDVKEVLHWTYLMNSRFQKLKNTLMKFRFLNFLFK